MEKLLILICLVTRFHGTIAYRMSSVQMQCSILGSCHCLWLKALSFRSIQMVHRVMPRKSCQILICLQNFFQILSPKHILFPLEAIVVVGPHLAQLVHDERDPSPSPPCLNTIPSFVFIQLTRVREAEDTLLRNGCRCDVNPPFINCYRFMPN